MGDIHDQFMYYVLELEQMFWHITGNTVGSFFQTFQSRNAFFLEKMYIISELSFVRKRVMALHKLNVETFPLLSQYFTLFEKLFLFMLQHGHEYNFASHNL